MAIELQKRMSIHQSILDKKMVKPSLKPVKVVSVFDVSGSAHGLFTQKTGPQNQPPMQEAFDRILAIAANLDDDGSMEVYAFSNASWRLPDADLSEYGQYIQSNIVNNGSINWGGTSYAPVLTEVVSAYSGRLAAIANAVQQQATSLFGKVSSFFGKKEDPKPAEDAKSLIEVTPAVVYFFTDGDNSDEYATREVISRAATNKYPIYFVMVGVGTSQFTTLRRLADEFDNVGFVSFTSATMDDETAYNSIVSDEFVRWLNVNA